MRLSTYKLHNSNQDLIGLLEDDRLINLNAFFGEISLIKLIQISEWQEKV